jgi:hypothetical protein
MVLGKPGEGKSSLLNGILGQQAFPAKLSVSVSVEIRATQGIIYINHINSISGIFLLTARSNQAC